MELIDSHCHLDFQDFDTDRDEVLRHAVRAGVRHIVIPGVRAATWADLLDLCRHRPNLFPALGLHPYFIHAHQTSDLDWLAAQLDAHPQAVVGEIGLDATCSDIHQQRMLFTAQVELACEYSRPVVVHHRKTQSELLQVLKKYRDKLPEIPGVIHAFSGSYEQAKAWADLGFKLGVGGTLTYERAQKTRAALTQIASNSLVLESDAPDMPLAGYQGQRNEPRRIREVLTVLASLRQEPETKLADVLWNNTCELFNLSG